MKRKFNIQLFTEDGGTVVGSDIVYLLRVKKDAATEDGVILAFTTQNNRSLSSGVGTTQTKDGPVATPGTVEETLSEWKSGKQICHSPRLAISMPDVTGKVVSQAGRFLHLQMVL